tara:strand:+ start:240 stop:650 length:411 start_codon:yes stop_codon:yes gene_type:complete
MAIEVQSKAFSAATVGAYRVHTSALSDTLAANDSSLASVGITHKLTGKKILVEFNVSVAFADVAANLLLEGSLTGESGTWATLATLTSDCTPNVTGSHFFVADLTDYSNVPYIRFHFNQNAQTVNQTGKCTFKYVF